MTTIRTYVVVLSTPRGLFDVEVAASSAERASRRARWSLISARYGDVEDVTIVSCTAGEFGDTENE